MSRFDFTVPEDDSNGPVVGVGEAANGRIRAVAAADGTLRKLTIAPDLLRRTRDGGTFLDSRELAAEITQAVNTAMSDLVRRAALAAAPGPDAFAGELAAVRTDLGRALNDVRAELERAERRIAGR